MSTKGPGSFYQVAQRPNPAAGAEFALTAPGQGLWRVYSIAFTLTTSAVVAARRVTLLADDQTDVWGVFPSTVDQAASGVVRYGAFGGAVGGGLATAALTIALPEGGVLLMPGHRLRSSTTLIDAGDQYTAIRALVQEFPAGPDEEWLPSVDTLISQMG